MGCDQLLLLLHHDGWAEGKDSTASQDIVAHVRTCPYCYHGIGHLSQTLLSKDRLTCEQCRTCFVDYYEATRSEYPLVKMSDEEIVRMVVHLGLCDTCAEEYEEFVLLSELEERGELLDS